MLQAELTWLADDLGVGRERNRTKEDSGAWVQRSGKAEVPMS